MRWDSVLSIEGVAAALALVGAASGYVINLIRAWRRDKQETAMIGTSFVIIELLERCLPDGLGEDELWESYRSGESEALRAKYLAAPPEKLSRVMFERRLRQLQFEGMVDPDGKDSWRVRSRPIAAYDLQDFTRASMRRRVREQIEPPVLLAIAARLLDGATGKYEKKDALELMARIDPNAAIGNAKTLLSSEQDDEAAAATEFLAGILKG